MKKLDFQAESFEYEEKMVVACCMRLIKFQISAITNLNQWIEIIRNQNGLNRISFNLNAF